MNRNPASFQLLNSTMKSDSLVLVLLLFTISVSTKVVSQDFVVTAKGDTLKGKVKLLLHSYDHKVQIQTADKQKSTLSILQTKTVFVDSSRFDPVKFNNRYSFMKLLKEGYLSLYGFQLERQLAYDGRYLLKKDGRGMEVPNLAFKKNMSSFLDDCETLSAAVAKGDYGRNDLDKIIDEFNSCIEKNTRVTSSSTTSLLTTPKLTIWNELETNVQASSISAKADALEMISDIKVRVSKGEKLPKFLVQGLTSALAENTDLSAQLEKALASIE